MNRPMGMLALLVAVTAQAQPSNSLVRATELPAAAQRLRESGVPDAEVAAALKASKDHKVPAAEATDLLDAGAHGGKLDNFGSFVKEQLDSGLRGRELARAIHDEQARRGTGKPGGGEGPPEGRGPDGGPPGQGGDGPGDEAGKGNKGKAPDGAGENKGEKGKAGKGGH
jgi:hypothetical protein